MTDRVFLAALAILVVPAVLLVYISLTEGALGRLPERLQTHLRPWLWLAPALAFLLAFLVYPVVRTVYLSFFSARSDGYVGLDNYRYLFTDETMLTALRNNALWLVVFTSITVGLGLLLAVLTDRVRYEPLAKAVIFLPMAISFVAAGVIWKFMYDYQPPSTPQTGTVNALATSVLPGFTPRAWLIDAPGNTIALIVAAAWAWTGFSMVILSAGLKGIPADVLEAARVDGAGEWQVFWRIIFPMLGVTLAVVTTTMFITALKVFDIVYVMTNGNFQTEVIANRMYKEMFTVRHYGHAAAIAVVLMAAIVPVMLFNLRRFRQQEATR